ncbi:MAG: ABC transporter ATP-binding protein [Defluviitaleaceae bacterium]|nr:ABC transporter ATP-binding protein [Defluviitaleaceae bacterium]
MSILEVKNLVKFYGNSPALRGISFDVPPGKIVGVLGPNGSGKTTLIKIIMSLLSGHSGEVLIKGLPPGTEANKIISYLPDVGHLPPWFKVFEAINLFADYYTDFDKPRAEQMLTSMKIPLDKKIKKLSRGMQEKVQIALVMSRRASLYLLDEPIGAVDPASREFILDTILRNFPEDASIVLSTHIIADIEPVLDIAIFLKDGEIILNDEVDNIREEKNTSLDSLFREMFRNEWDILQ